MIVGTIYGVVLNDDAERRRLSGAFLDKPYGAPPIAPVVYIKPRTCVRAGGAATPFPAGVTALEAAATIALLFGADAGRPVAAALALDVSEPHENYYRPAIVQRCRDGFLPLGAFSQFDERALTASEIITSVNGAEAHRWSLKRLNRNVATLIADLSSFMTLADGDALLIGLPGDAPRVKLGDVVHASHSSLQPVSAHFEPELLS